MSEERNNVEIIPEFKMYITDLETNKDSKEINVSDLIFNDYIEFEFGDYEDEDYGTLPYKDFKFFINDYSVTFYSPQMKDLQQKVEQLEKENEHLRTQVNTYENPNDLTLFYMWLDEKAKDKIKQLENIRKETIEFINEWLFEAGGNGADMDYDTIVDLLNILNKGDNNGRK